MKTEEQQKRIGIVGGMGPMAGVLLQRLIIEATPATKDQDHLQVICFTNPQIPDRTLSLRKDNGASYLEAVIHAANLLVSAGATQLVIPCNTAHAKFEVLQNAIPVPVVNMVEHAAQFVAEAQGGIRKIGILATDATLQSRIYQIALEKYGVACAVSSGANQQKVMETIYAIKAGESVSLLASCEGAIAELVRNGTDAILLGCTELSLCFEEVRDAGYHTVDPLRIVADAVVKETDPVMAEASERRLETAVDRR